MLRRSRTIHGTTINAAVTNSGIGAVKLVAGGAVALGGNVSGGGQVNFNHAGALTQTAGIVSATSQLMLSGLGAVGTSGAPLNTSAALRWIPPLIV